MTKQKGLSTFLYALLQVALGKRNCLPYVPSEREWELLWRVADKQTVAGICFYAMERLPKEQLPEKKTIFKWYSYSQHVEQQNREIAVKTKETYDFFCSLGLKPVILKGMGMAKCYKDGNENDNLNEFGKLGLRRQCGDIDVWVKCGRRKLYEIAKRHSEDGKLKGATYHHIHFPMFSDIEVEAHIYPTYFYNPFTNSKLHSFFKRYELRENEMFPSAEFNRVYILIHCFQHLIGHGVGLRQVMDYYFVLNEGFTEEGKRNTVCWLKRLGMMRFAAGMMWIMKELFLLEDEKLLTTPDEKEGRFILEDIWMAGNMGHGETRDWGSLATPLSRFLYSIRRDCHFITHYPHEVIWQPVFNIWVFLHQKLVWK